MAKFTCDQPLNIAWEGNDLIGTSTTTYRIPDALYDEFVAKVVPSIKGTVTWLDTDEVATIGIPQHSTLLGVTADQHHAQVHSISGADHTGTLPHSSLGSIGATDHHAAPVAGPDTDVTIDAAGAAGTAGAFARSLHGHKITTASASPSDISGSSASAGTSGTAPARGDHRHQMPHGTSFPGSPATNDIYFRTDLGLWFFYDGTRWLSMTLFKQQLRWDRTANSMPLTATTTAAQASGIPHFEGGSDLWLVNHHINFQVAAGTALSASHKWVGTLQKFDTNIAATTIATSNITSGASSVYRTIDTAIGALLGSTSFFLATTWTKTGTPGNINTFEEVTYRIVAT